MKNKNQLVNGITAILVLSLFAMCTKKLDKNETPLADTTGAAKRATTSALSAGGYTYSVQLSQWEVDGTSFPAGSVISIPAGTRGALLFKNLKGTAAKPIIIINKGGQVIISTSVTASYAFKTLNCHYFKVLGNGVRSVPYGFVVNGGNLGMTLDGLSSDFEISNVEVRNSGFAGIVAKTDPTCDITTQRGHFTMKNISIHNNYVHKTGGEGLYIGNSFYAAGMKLSCGTVFPGDVVDAIISYNITDSTGNEGIQVGSATFGCEIYGNSVKNTGLSPLAAFQNNGIQLGEGTGGKCFNNVIMNAPGDGIICLGLGDNLVFNNYIINAGAEGIFVGTRYTPGPNFQFINNTIVNPGDNGIKFDSENIPMNTAINNVIVHPGSGVGIVKMSSSVKLTELNNYITTDINSIKFVNFNGGNYHLLSTSPLINKGANVLSHGVTFDYYDTKRPYGGAFDIGATEY